MNVPYGMETAEDITFMRRALALALRSCGHTRPNPPVGAVVVKGGRIVGEGRHVRCGCDHAEVAALKLAIRRGADLRGAAVFVTLEPCSRPGRVGACCDALISAGVSKVVWAVPDPNPKNAGRAARVLRRAGIVTECWNGSRFATKRECAESARALMAPFAKHVNSGMPYVTVKIAMSLDGRICDEWGDARWVSSDRARRTTGHLRETADVVLVGAETVRRDNPSLLSHGRRNDDLFRAVVTRSGDLPAASHIFTDAAKNRTLVFRIARGKTAARRTPDGQICVPDLRSALKHLGDMGFMHVLCEGGLELARSLAVEGLVDEWLAVMAPKVIGHGRIAAAARIPRVTVLADM